jgi:hypothetical protein
MPGRIVDELLAVCRTNSFDQLQNVVTEICSMGYSAAQIVAQVLPLPLPLPLPFLFLVSPFSLVVLLL